MKVEFNAEEVHQMLEAVMADVGKLKMDKHDRAVTHRWLTDEMTPGSMTVQRLTEKVNEEIQRLHDRSEVSAIKKPDWL